MCISAAVSYGSAIVLVGTGLHALRLSLRLARPYWALALVPIFFGIQQAFEGRVWQMIDRGDPTAAVPFALGFLFFSHFHWLWWIPLSSYLIEPGVVRRRIFIGVATFGGMVGGMIFLTMLVHPELVEVGTRQLSIVYKLTSPYESSFSIPVPASAIYGLVILLPLIGSSLRQLRIFGWLIAASLITASIFYGYAIVSVWCLFAALLSLYLVVALRQIANSK